MTNRFKVARAASDWSQGEAANICAIGQMTYCRRENNPEEFRLVELRKMYLMMHPEARELLKDAIEKYLFE